MVITSSRSGSTSTDSGASAPPKGGASAETKAIHDAAVAHAKKVADELKAVNKSVVNPVSRDPGPLVDPHAPYKHLEIAGFKAWNSALHDLGPYWDVLIGQKGHAVKIIGGFDPKDNAFFLTCREGTPGKGLSKEAAAFAAAVLWKYGFYASIEFNGAQEDDTSIAGITWRNAAERAAARAATEARRKEMPDDLKEDPLGGFSRRRLVQPAKYEDPEAAIDALREQIIAALKVGEQEEFDTFQFVKKMLNEIWGNYNKKNSDRIFIKTGPNVFLSILAACKEIIELPEFKTMKKGLFDFITKKECESAIRVLTTPLPPGSKMAKSQARTAAVNTEFGLLGQVNLVEVEEKGITAKDQTSFFKIELTSSTPAAHVNKCVAFNYIAYLCSWCDHKKNATVERTFNTFKYRTAATSVERPIISLLITKRIEAVSALKTAIPTCALTADSEIAKYIRPDAETKLVPFSGVVVQPALFGFRCYMANLKGVNAKNAARVTTMLGATCLNRAGQQVHRCKAVLTKTGMIDPSAAVEYAMFICTASDDSFNAYLSQ